MGLTMECWAFTPPLLSCSAQQSPGTCYFTFTFELIQSENLAPPLHQPLVSAGSYPAEQHEPSISVHSSSVFLLLPHTLFLSSSDFLPSLCLYLSSVLQFPFSSLLLLLSVSLLAYLYHLSFLSISPFILLIDLTSLSLPLFLFSLMIILTTLNFLGFQHLRSLRIGIW